MALVVESTSSASVATSNSVTVTKPTGVAVGDLLLIISNTANGGITCSGFTSAGSWTTTLGADCTIQALYKIADSGDVSASNYSVSGPASEMGIVAMFRISGWVSGNPIYQSASGGFAPTTSGTHTVSGLSLLRSTQQILIMVGSSYDAVNADYISAFTTYTVTSGDSNPTWTEVIDTNVTTGGGSLGKVSMGVAYATTTSDSTITGFSYAYTENDSDDTCGAIGVLLVLNQPVNATTDVSHLATTPVVFGPTVSQVNIALDMSHNAVTPTLNGLTAKAQRQAEWVNPNKPTTTWVNPDK